MEKERAEHGNIEPVLCNGCFWITVKNLHHEEAVIMLEKQVGGT